ncbi:SDR family oxidoreductase [Pseudooceanicola sp. CBS1P-1]|uniref:SDR family NAD(P)-dependent oxidoreductase n=1 Tax=Pseudooceanicola albus TaxID=2692189 RepID=A0A6L7G2Q6_9RHOB|nr:MULTISPECIES: SDR family oxidoreductase [Pseudooceanicola]MBT9384786.1 SDR family oxidoreductase [Pseudooceanicola endophyticus]MXN18219.1 SDR family NAD(P)-dependent oxidoreductase [Pseudooceanicola albus]
MSTILITGASDGIGAATARKFLDVGWTVGLLARRTGPLRALAEDYRRAIVLPADVTDETQVIGAFAEFIQRAGRLDVLFNNAGQFGPSGPIDTVTLEDWRRVVDVNLTGMFLCARAAFSQMRHQHPMGGRIINNGSISAHAPREGAVAYTATKHAVTGLTKSLSLDGRPHDIACGQIDIGNARTGLLEEAVARNPDDPPPVIEVEEVARAVLHMANLPLSANIQFMTLMATKMPYIGRG